MTEYSTTIPSAKSHLVFVALPGGMIKSALAVAAAAAAADASAFALSFAASLGLGSPWRSIWTNCRTPDQKWPAGGVS